MRACLACGNWEGRKLLGEKVINGKKPPGGKAASFPARWEVMN